MKKKIYISDSQWKFHVFAFFPEIFDDVFKLFVDSFKVRLKIANNKIIIMSKSAFVLSDFIWNH